MKNRLKRFYFFIIAVVIAILHWPVAFAKSPLTFSTFLPSKDSSGTPIDSSFLIAEHLSLYDSLQLSLQGLSEDAFNYAKKGFDKLLAEGKLLNTSILSIVDFSLPSTKKRLFIIDLKNYKVLFNSLIAHGRNTGKEIATSFSNKKSSYKSSPGFYVTGDTYNGKNGYSLKLDGLEKGINDHAFDRGIVIHGANYVNETLANEQGYIGRSQGCPAVPLSQSKPIINTIKNGTCLFIYHPAYIRQSAILR